MKIIIAPTKKQSIESVFKSWTQPQFLEQSDFLRTNMKALSKEGLKTSLKISDKLIKEVHDYYHSNQETVPALALYTGAVFNAADFQSYSKEELTEAEEKLIVLSAMYGPLRLFDKVQPYRLDFYTKIGFNLYDYWEKEMENFNNKLDEPIINLASKEFSKMMPQDLLIDITFLEENGKTQATNAKIARGTMVKYIIQNNINTLDDLKKFNLRDYNYKKDQSSTRELVFSR